MNSQNAEVKLKERFNFNYFFGEGNSLFPSPKEISFGCSCPDWAIMCKHVAAVLYGVGARLDDINNRDLNQKGKKKKKAK